MEAYRIPDYTISDYINLEQTSDIKHEYHDGKICPTSCDPINHGLLCGNIYTELRNGLSKNQSNCKPLNSEIKLFIERTNSFVYPDTMVICGEIETSKVEHNSATNPTLIVEVLSKSTALYDRSDKFFMYRQIPSLKEYVLIEQNKPLVEVFYKPSNDDLWKINRFEGLDESIFLKSINLEIKMADLYFDIISNK